MPETARDQKISPRKQSTSELVMGIADDARLLLRKELELARLELTGGIKAQLKGAGVIALAIAAALPGLLFLVVALALALPLWLPIHAATGFAIVGVALLLATGIGVAIGVGIMRSRKPSVDMAVESIKEDVRWARDRLTS